MASPKPTLMTLPVELQIQILLALSDIRDQAAASITCDLWRHLYRTDPSLRRSLYHTSASSGIPHCHKLLDPNGSLSCDVDSTTGELSCYYILNMPFNKYDIRLHDVSDYLFLDDPLLSPFEDSSAIYIDAESGSADGTPCFFTTLNFRDGDTLRSIRFDEVKIVPGLTVREFITRVATSVYSLLQDKEWTASILRRAGAPTRPTDTLILRFWCGHGYHSGRGGKWYFACTIDFIQARPAPQRKKRFYDLILRMYRGIRRTGQ
ncbi:hypothetical protein TWF696_000433 [Orbilia brochopaga]|uniref:F-box domain-containing protein n=1 Tax=Orbilia brochopaga TaxID=3140254 RepID=A0AAV9VBC8_9PEZI